MYVIDYVSNIVREWAALLLRYVGMGMTWMGYEIGFWAAPHSVSHVRCALGEVCTSRLSRVGCPPGSSYM